MSILLDDDEIRDTRKRVMVLDPMGFSADREINMINFGARNQARKIVDIIKRDCPETLFLLEDLKFWHDLLGEIE